MSTVSKSIRSENDDGQDGSESDRKTYPGTAICCTFVVLAYELLRCIVAFLVVNDALFASVIIAHRPATAELLAAKPDIAMSNTNVRAVLFVALGARLDWRRKILLHSLLRHVLIEDLWLLHAWLHSWLPGCHMRLHVGLEQKAGFEFLDSLFQLVVAHFKVRNVRLHHLRLHTRLHHLLLHAWLHTRLLHTRLLHT